MNTELHDALDPQPPSSYQEACEKLDKKNTAHSSKGAIIQHYSLNVEQQPAINTSGFTDKIKPYVDKLNAGLQTAQNHAVSYRKKLLPKILARIDDALSYYQTHQALEEILNDPTSKVSYNDLITYMNDLLDDVNDPKDGYLLAITQTKKAIDKFETDLNSDVKTFAYDLSQFTNAVGGADIVNKYEQELEIIQQNYEKAVELFTASCFASAIGVFLVIAGAVGDVFSFGAATVAVVGGIALLGAGTTGEAAEGLKMEDLATQKNQLLTKIHEVQQELAQSKAIEKGYSGLGTQCKAAACAVGDFAVAWSLLQKGIKDLIKWVKKIKGKDSVKHARLYMKSLSNTIKKIVAQVNSIEKKFTDSSKHGKELKASLLRYKMDRIDHKVAQLRARMAAGETAGVKLLVASINMQLNSLAEKTQDPDDGGLVKYTDFTQPIYTLIKKYVPNT